MTNKYEQLIEFIINDESDKARELFHTIVVEKSRDIYESLIDETDLENAEVQEIADEIAIDEQGISEEEDQEGAEDEAPALDADEAGDDHHDDVGGDDELEDRVMDLEDALDELKAEFDALMAGEEPHADLGDEGSELGDVQEQGEFFEAEDADKDEDKDECDESKEVVKEYVEKAPAPTTTEEGAVNKSSTVAGKNDMGGQNVNVTAGGTSNPDGTSPKATVKPKGELIGKNLATPGADAGKAFAKKESAVSKEEGAVNATSPLAK